MSIEKLRLAGKGTVKAFKQVDKAKKKAQKGAFGKAKGK